MSRENLFCDKLFIFRKLHLQQLKGMQSSKQGISERGFQFLIEGI